ncbi:leucine-rich repeat containing protein, putative [Ricinus communis]|uniref:ADP-ribosyl cyclase/cyclic ADP-ribose hydrolase n=1 Tax=Ricinus communis TaxID=3988 RepID=B9S9D5_RICCO|nr:leucine-rich repeat containing protein, putative [Ricinus communis]|eukprot:XP_025013765.1 disease resistance-like protein DSC1 [Ricinus communis]
MASSFSASARIQNWKYDVFLSFRGEDTRNNFISHLHAALSRKSIRTFIDDELRRGDEITRSLLKKIEESKIAVVIFSRNYASSTYCLDELEKIIEFHECYGQTVIPIFFNVNPSDLLEPDTGIFAEALSRHEKDIMEKLNKVQGWKKWWKDSVIKAANFLMLHSQVIGSEQDQEKLDKVQRWKVALKKAGNLSGHDLQIIRRESELVDKIVSDVWKRVKQVSPSISDCLVGVDLQIERIKSLLLVGLSDVRVLGIWGMGGIGKTTLAGAVFKQIAFQFEGCCFLSNIGKESQKCGGLTRLGEELLSKVLKEREVKLNTPDIRSSHFKEMLRHNRVLIVLDDVNNIEQLEYFAGDPCWFGSGSRIFVTSRDKQLLSTTVDVTYEVKELNYEDALHLVCWNAFKQKSPLEDFVALTHLVVRYARGNPLALKVLGSMLYGKSKTEWGSALKKLTRAPHKDIQDILKFTYDNLDDEELDIFLHIACLFESEDRDRVTQALDGCGFSADIGISTLVDKSLLTISKNKLKMHDLLQEMGREIVRQESKRPSERSRLWNPDDIYKVLEENTGTEAIVGILLGMSEARKLELNRNAFTRISNLKFLILRMSNNCGGFEEECKVQFPEGLESLPQQLRYLYWHGYPLKFLPANFHPTNLIELNFPYSRLEGLWEGDKVPSSIGQLTKLTFMSLRCSKNIRSFPTTIDLQSLETLDLSGCSNLKIFPEVSRNIRYLYLNETAIQEVPLSIEHLSKLVVLNMKNCNELECIPSTIFKLKSLGVLILSGCKKLESFPEILETTNHLQHLSLDETAMVNLPDTFCNLKALNMLNFSDCSKLGKLPKNMKNLKSLAELRAGGCNLSTLPADLKYLSSIVELNLSGSNFDTMPAGINQLSKLRWINVTGCKRLQSLPELPPRIRYLNARDCRSLVSISGLKQLFELGCSNSLDDETFVFTNCFKLDQDNWADILASAQLKIQHFAMGRKHYDRELYDETFICFTYPGTEIPEWFADKSIGSSVTIQHLPPDWLNHRFLGFSVCLVVAFDDRFLCEYPRGVVACKCNFQNSYGGCNNHIFTLNSWKYFPAMDQSMCSCGMIAVGMVENANFPEVEKCGVLLLYSKDEESNQMELVPAEVTKKRSGSSAEEKEEPHLKKMKELKGFPVQSSYMEE